MGSSRTRARTRVPCIGRQILNHCTTREAQNHTFLKKVKSVVTFLELEVNYLTLKMFYVYRKLSLRSNCSILGKSNQNFGFCHLWKWCWEKGVSKSKVLDTHVILGWLILLAYFPAWGALQCPQQLLCEYFSALSRL